MTTNSNEHNKRDSQEQEVEATKSLYVDQGDDYLVISRKWYSHQVVIMGLFCVPLSAFVASCYLPIIRGVDFDLMGLLLPAPFLLVTVLLIYGTLAGLLNSTTIRADSECVRALHGPVPWKRKVTFQRDKISRFLVSQKANAKTSRSFNLCVQENKDLPRVLVSGLPNLREAHHIKEKLEQFHQSSRPHPSEATP